LLVAPDSDEIGTGSRKRKREDERTSVFLPVLAVLRLMSDLLDEQKSRPWLSLSEGVFPDEMAFFLLTLAQKGYVPIPTFDSNHGQTPGYIPKRRK
jgi:hypothetical protein